MEPVNEEVARIDNQIEQLEREIRDIQSQIDAAKRRKRVDTTWLQKAQSAQRHKRNQVRSLVEEKRGLFSGHPERSLVKRHFPEIVKVLIQIARSTDRAFDDDLSDDEVAQAEKETWAALDSLDELWPNWRSPSASAPEA